MTDTLIHGRIWYDALLFIAIILVFVWLVFRMIRDSPFDWFMAGLFTILCLLFTNAFIFNPPPPLAQPSPLGLFLRFLLFMDLIGVVVSLEIMIAQRRNQAHITDRESAADVREGILNRRDVTSGRREEAASGRENLLTERENE